MTRRIARLGDLPATFPEDEIGANLLRYAKSVHAADPAATLRVWIGDDKLFAAWRAPEDTRRFLRRLTQLPPSSTRWRSAGPPQPLAGMRPA